MALVAVLVPVLVVVLTAPVLLIVCAWLWKSRLVSHASHLLQVFKNANEIDIIVAGGMTVLYCYCDVLLRITALISCR